MKWKPDNKNNSQIKAGVVLYYINTLVGNLIPVFYTPIMLSLLGQNEYGLYKLASSVTSYLSLISLGMGAAVSRYLIKAGTEEGQEAEENVLGLFMVIFRIISIVSLAVGILISFNLHFWYQNSLSPEELNRMRILVLILSVNMAVSFSASPYITAVSAHERFIFMQTMNIIATCVVPICNLIILFLGYKSIGMAVSSLSLGVLTRIIYVWYVQKRMQLRARYNSLPKYLIREIFAFSFWIFVANVVGHLYNSTDTVMIGTVASLGTVGVAVYNVGSVFNNIVFSLTTGISSLLSPKTQKMVFAGATSSELTDLAVKVGRLQAFIISLIVTGFISFGKPFIHFYAGAGYEDAYWVAVLMMIPNMIPLVQSVFLSIIIAQNKHKFRSLVYLGIAILNVIGTWFLMHTSLGIVGAALMTGVALVIGQGFVMNWYYRKKIGLEIGRFWKSVGVIYIIPAVMAVVTHLVSRAIDFYRIVPLFAGIAVYTVIFCILNWGFVMNTYEKELIMNPIRKLLNRRTSLH